MHRFTPAHVKYRIAVLRDSAFELHEQLTQLVRESTTEAEREELAQTALCIESVTDQLGAIDAVMAPHRMALARTAVRR